MSRWTIKHYISYSYEDGKYKPMGVYQLNWPVYDPNRKTIEFNTKYEAEKTCELLNWYEQQLADTRSRWELDNDFRALCHGAGVAYDPDLAQEFILYNKWKEGYTAVRLTKKGMEKA